MTSQFGNPTGALGWLVGTVMAFENRERNRWAVTLLDVQPTDYLLEVGFGPGLAIQHMASLATQGFVAGIDQSAVMLDQATQRNRAAIQAGRIELKKAEVSRISYPDRHFDKAIVINSLHHWPAHQAGIQEIKRVLKGNGLLILVEQPRGSATAAMLTTLSSRLMKELELSGFHAINYVVKEMKPAASVAALGRA